MVATHHLGKFIVAIGAILALASCALLIGGDNTYLDGTGGALSATGAGGAGGVLASTARSGAGSGTTTSTASSGAGSGTSTSTVSSSASSAASTSSTGGGVPACAAGTFGDLANDFNDNTLDSLLWGTYPDAVGQSVKLLGGDIQMTGMNAGVFSKKTYSLHDCRASIKVSNIPQPSALNVFFQVQFNGDSTRLLSFVQTGSVLSMEVHSPDITTDPVLLNPTYKPLEDVYWQLRISDATRMAYWETSKDGILWQTRASYGTSGLFPTSNLVVQMGIDGGGGTPVVHFDNFNKP